MSNIFNVKLSCKKSNKNTILLILLFQDYNIIQQCSVTKPFLYFTVLYSGALYSIVLKNSVLSQYCSVLAHLLLGPGEDFAHMVRLQTDHLDSAVQCIFNEVQCSAVQCIAVQCSAAQCSAVQCSTVYFSSDRPEEDRVCSQFF